MCPDDELLSAYLDGELPPESVRSMEQQLAEDSYSRHKFNQLSVSREALHSQPEPDFAGAQERVWERIQASSRRMHEPADIFHKRIQVPIPMAAAAAFVLLVAGMLFAHFALTRGLVDAPIQTADASAGGEVTVQLSELDDLSLLLDALNSDGTVRQIRIEMPENSRFAYQGEARFIRTQDSQVFSAQDSR